MYTVAAGVEALALSLTQISDTVRDRVLETAVFSQPASFLGFPAELLPSSGQNEKPGLVSNGLGPDPSAEFLKAGFFFLRIDLLLYSVHFPILGLNPLPMTVLVTSDRPVPVEAW